MATAMARLSVTIGLPVIRSSTPYSARICGQSVCSAVTASSWTAAIVGLQLVLADGAAGAGPLTATRSLRR